MTDVLLRGLLTPGVCKVDGDVEGLAAGPEYSMTFVVEVDQKVIYQFGPQTIRDGSPITDDELSGSNHFHATLDAGFLTLSFQDQLSKRDEAFGNGSTGTATLTLRQGFGDPVEVPTLALGPAPKRTSTATVEAGT